MLKIYVCGGDDDDADQQSTSREPRTHKQKQRKINIKIVSYDTMRRDLI